MLYIMDYTFHAIGLIRSPFSDPGETPIQSARSQSPGQVILNPEYAPGLQDLECFSHIILLYAFHRSQGYSLLVQPFLDDIQHGLFSTRYPFRPNPLGLSVVQLDEVCDNVLKISGVDVLDGTPLLDIKPYVPDFDVHAATRIGWYATRTKR
jgi:tRNA (adenine37-N6)-methyltransferase